MVSFLPDTPARTSTAPDVAEERFEVPLRYLRVSPQGWFESTLPNVARYNSDFLNNLREGLLQEPDWESRTRALRSFADRFSEERWHAATGVQVSESKFTVLVPIHNEEALLDTFLACLMFSRIPAAVRANIVFFTNACTDSSEKIINNFMHSLGAKIENCDRLKSLCDLDKGLNPEMAMVRVGNINFLHLNTSTRSKAHVLNIGNHLAVMDGHQIAMCVDANNWPEPDAISKLFSDAYVHICRDHDAVALSGEPLMEVKPSRFSIYGNFAKLTHNGTPSLHSESFLSGCLCAWDTAFVEKIGIPKTAIEDYALGVQSRSFGYAIAQCLSARIWGYDPASIADVWRQHKRSVRGVLQILSQIEGTEREAEILSVLKRDGKLQSFSERVIEVVSKSIARPLRTPVFVCGLIVRELARIAAQFEYNRDPNNASWEPIASTKHL